MSAFAGKVSAGRGRPWWWIGAVAMVTAVLVATGISARAEAAAGVVVWTPYSGSIQFTDESCGYPIAVAATFSGRVGFRAGTGPDAGYAFFTDQNSFREVHTDPATGRTFVVMGNHQFKEVKATPVGGNVFEVTAKDSGQPLIVEDSTGNVVLRFAGLATYRYTVETAGFTIVEFLGTTLAGHYPGGSACSAAGSILGKFDSASRLTAHPIGTTASPLGYYDYLPPGYGPGAKDPLLIFLHGHGGNGDGTPAQLPNVINDAGIAYYIANNGWAADRPFVVLAPQHNEIASPAYPYACDLFVGSCVMQQQHAYGNPLPAGSPCWAPSEVRAFVDYALAHYNVDPTRVYLTGLSCGGYGVWESLAQFGAGKIAAAVPIAGDGRPALGSSGCALASVPIWAFHGDADDTVYPAGSIDTITALRTCPAPPAKELRLTVYPGVGHDSWDHAYSGSQGQDIYGWMLGFTTG